MRPNPRHAAGRLDLADDAHPDGPRLLRRQPGMQSEHAAKLAQKLGQLSLVITALPQECMGHLASFGPT
jgi:hypothetical protein